MREIIGEMREYARINGIPVIRKEMEQLLTALVFLEKPNRVLELGTAIGYSAAIIRSVAPEECVIDTVENDYDMVLRATEYIKRSGHHEYINIIYGDAPDVLMNLKSRYDLIFFDAAKNQYNEYLKHSFALMSPGALLIADNIHYKGLVRDTSYNKRKNRTVVLSLRQFIASITSDERLDTIILDISDGVSLSRFKGCEKTDGENQKS